MSLATPSFDRPSGTLIHRFAVVSCAAGLAFGAVALPASAEAETAEPATTATTAIPARLERACLRVPNLTIRTENAIERLSGEADTRGSLLWLDERITQASKLGLDGLATVLTNRRAVREQTLEIMQTRLGGLEQIAERCTEAGVL